MINILNKGLFVLGIVHFSVQCIHDERNHFRDFAYGVPVFTPFSGNSRNLRETDDEALRKLKLENDKLEAEVKKARAAANEAERFLHKSDSERKEAFDNATKRAIDVLNNGEDVDADFGFVKVHITSSKKKGFCSIM